MIDDNETSSDITANEWAQRVRIAEREAANEQNQLGSKRSRKLRKRLAQARRRMDRRSETRKAIRAISSKLKPTPHERVEQRRTANAQRIGKLTDQQVMDIQPRDLPSEGDAVSRQSRALPAFYHQQFGGRSQAQLLEMRDWPRSRVPSQFTMREWKDQIRGELHNWVAAAVRPETLKQPRQQEIPTSPTPAPKPSVQDSAAAVVNQIAGGESEKPDPKPVADPGDIPNQVDAASKPPIADTPKPSPPSMLSGPDVSLLHARAIDVINDREKFRRWNMIHNDKVHPDTGKPIDIEAETARTSPPRFQDAAKNVVDESMRPADQQFGNEDREPKPSRRSTALDVAQLGADAVGVVDPTGIVDASNAAVSFTRAIFDKERRSDHVKNGLISMASIIPFGDVAKLGKLGRAGKTLRNAEHLTDAAKAAEHGGGATAKGGRTAGNAATDAELQAAKGGVLIPPPVQSFDSEPWKGDSLNRFVDEASKGKAVPLKPGEKPSMASLFQSGANGADTARTFLEHSGGMSSDGKTDAAKASEAMKEMQKQSQGLHAQQPQQPASAGGGSGGVTPPPITAGFQPSDDSSKDPNEIEKRNDAEKKRTEVQDRFTDKLQTAALWLGTFGAATVAAVKTMDLVTGWNSGNAERGRPLADFNGKISGAFVGAEIDDMRRNIRQGETTQDAIAGSVEADSRNKDLKERFSSPVQSIGTDASAATTNAVNAIINMTDNLTGASSALKGMSMASGWVTDKFNWLTKAASDLSENLPGAKLRKWMGGDDDANADRDRGTPWANVLDDVRDGKFDVKSEAGNFFNEGL